MKVSYKKAKSLGDSLNLNWKVVKLEEFKVGIETELEHGKILGGITNITDDNLELTSKITVAHLIEDPRYYFYLKRLEAKRDLFWKNKKKPNIFL